MQHCRANGIVQETLLAHENHATGTDPQVHLYLCTPSVYSGRKSVRRMEKKVSPPVILLKKKSAVVGGVRYDGESCVMISGTGTVQQISFGRENRRNDTLTRMDGKRAHGFGVKT
jgi:hypothetical protein